MVGPPGPRRGAPSQEPLESGSVFHFSICWHQQCWPYGDVKSWAGSFSSQEGVLICQLLQITEAREVADTWGHEGRRGGSEKGRVGLSAGIWCQEEGRLSLSVLRHVGSRAHSAVAEAGLMTQAHETLVPSLLHTDAGCHHQDTGDPKDPARTRRAWPAKGAEQPVSHILNQVTVAAQSLLAAQHMSFPQSSVPGAVPGQAPDIELPE